MIAKTSAFWGLVEKFKGLRVENPIDELLVFFAWQHLVQKDLSQKMPTFDDVIHGKLSLEDAFLKIEENLESKYLVFYGSKAKDLLSPADIRSVCHAVTELRDLDRYELLKTCLKLRSGSRKNQGLHIFENELMDFLVSLVDAQKGMVYAPYDSNLQVSIHCAARGFKVVYSHANAEPFNEFASLIADLRDENFEARNDLDYLFGDAPLRESTQQYSRMILIPPFGASHEKNRKEINSEVRLIENAISRCTGSLVVVVPQGVLFRGGESSEFRREIIVRGLLGAVIQLPTPLLRGTSLALSILVINKDANRQNTDAIFIDASSQMFSESTGRGTPSLLRNTQQLADIALRKAAADHEATKIAAYSEIIENRFELSVSKYVIGKASERLKESESLLRLEDIATLIRGQQLKEEKAEILSAREFLEVGVRDIGEDGVIRVPEKAMSLLGDMASRAEKQRLYPGDILLVTKGSVGKVGIVANCGENWVASQSFQIIRLGRHNQVCTSAFLYMYLSSSLMQSYFREHVTGTTIPVLKTGDIRGLPIPVPSMEECNKVDEEYAGIRSRWQEIQSLKEEIMKIRNTRWDIAS